MKVGNLMSKRTFSPEFKANVVLEVISGEKTIDQAASEYDLLPNLIRNWKKEFLQNASIVFDNKLQKQKDAPLNDSLIKQVDQLTRQVDWMKKKSTEIFGSDWKNIFGSEPKK